MKNIQVIEERCLPSGEYETLERTVAFNVGDISFIEDCPKITMIESKIDRCKIAMRSGQEFYVYWDKKALEQHLGLKVE